MSNEGLYPPPLDRLKEFGRPSDAWDASRGAQDYVAELGLTFQHVPGLLRVARQWLDADWDAEQVEPDVWAPIYAWRALGQLGAVEAVEPLLEMMDGLDKTDDDWHMEEFPEVFARIGPDAVDALRRYVADPTHGRYPRSVAGHGLVQIAKRRPECRDAAVAALGSALAAYEENGLESNAFLVTNLLELKGVEQAELIERAFAAGQVDDEICGYWDHVREELGVEGLGLAPDRPPRPRQTSYLRLDGPEPLSKEERLQQRKQRKKLRAKQKQKQKARKRNRKGK